MGREPAAHRFAAWRRHSAGAPPSADRAVIGSQRTEHAEASFASARWIRWQTCIAPSIAPTAPCLWWRGGRWFGSSMPKKQPRRPRSSRRVLAFRPGVWAGLARRQG